MKERERDKDRYSGRRGRERIMSKKMCGETR